MSKQKDLKMNAVLNIIKTLSAIVFPLITFPYVTRTLLPENMGKVNFAQSCVSYFALIASLGISTHAIRECAIAKHDKELLNHVSSELFSINLITTVIAYFFLFISLLIFGKVKNYALLIIIESMTIISTTFGTEWVNNSMEDYKFITVRTIVFQIISIALILIFIKTPNDYYKYALISVLSTSGANVMNAFYRKKYCDLRFSFNIDWERHLKPILFLFAMQLSVTIFNNADITMLGLMKGDYQVGLYSTALKISRIISQIVQSLSFVVIPRLTILFNNQDFEHANKILRKVLGFNLTLGLPCVVGTLLIADEIVLLVGGPEYIEAAQILRIIILAFMFSLIGGSFLGNAVLIPMKNEKYYMMVCSVTAIINILLNMLLIPKYSSLGAAFATALNGLIIMVLLILKVDRRIKISNLKPIIIAPISGCALIVICCALCRRIEEYRIRTVISVIFSAIAYFIVQIVFRNDIVLEAIKDLYDKATKRVVKDFHKK